MRWKRLEAVGRSLRKMPQAVATHSLSRWSTKPRCEVTQVRPSAGSTRRIFPVAGLTRATLPGFTTAHTVPSDVSPSHRTLSPPRPFFLVQVRGGPPPSNRAKPREVPTQSAPFLSRTMLQIKSDGSPCALVQDSHSP